MCEGGRGPKLATCDMPNRKGGSNSDSNSQSEIDVIHYALVAPLPRLGRCKYLSKKYTPAERIIDTALILQGAVAICISDGNLDISFAT